MIKTENVDVFGFRAALRGMRNAMNSWEKADSIFFQNGELIEIGDNDYKLLTNLTTAGPSHRKALRMIHIQMDVTAPLYWWKDYDTYKVATVANSCSTMHKLHTRDLTLDDFAHEHLDSCGKNSLILTIDTINAYRKKFIDSKLTDKGAWYNMIQLLTTSYLQKRTIDINYETALALINDRDKHKLYEFREFTNALRELPYMEDIVKASRR